MKEKISDSGKIDFVGKNALFASLSGVLVLIAIGYLWVHGLNWGIDFSGGTEIQFRFNASVPISEVRGSLSGLDIGTYAVQRIGEGDEFVLRFQGKAGANDKETNNLLQESIGKVKEQIQTQFASYAPDLRRVDTVGPQVGGELKRSGYLAVFYCLLVILIYVGLRFDYKYAPGAVICLFHDAVLTLALYVFLGKEVNLPTMAAVLTLIGYSLNDTIVVFDRIRETEHLEHNHSLAFIINKAINETLLRTIITVLTTFISALSLLFVAGGTVGEIALIMVFGIIFGTYSSIYVAAPIMLLFERAKSVSRVVKPA